MLPPTMTGAADDDGAGGPILGSGRAPQKEAEDPDQWVKDGEASVKWMKDMLARVQVEGTDSRRGALVLGSVEESFPRIAALLDAHQVAHHHVEGMWVVPGFILKDLDGPNLRWHEVRGRLGPFLKNDFWRKVNAEVGQGRAVDWQAMGLQAQNWVVVRHRRELREMVRSLYQQTSWAGTKRLARGLYASCTRQQAFGLLVSFWPFRWWWLVAWLCTDLAIYGSYKLTADVLPLTWHDVLMLWLANAMVFGFVLKHRGEADGHLSDAASFKTAGSVALRKGKLDVAVEQYLCGEQSAAKLVTLTSLNAAFQARAPPLRLACLNNAALVRLKKMEWQEAADLCYRALALPGVGLGGGGGGVCERTADDVFRLPLAKTHFRLAIAQAKLGDADLAREALLTAHHLVPSDMEVVGMLRVLEWGAERQARAREEEADAAEADALEAEAALHGAPPMPPVKGGRRPPAGAASTVAEPLRDLGAADAARAQAAFGALMDPKRDSDAASFGAWAPPADADAAADAADASSDATPAAPETKGAASEARDAKRQKEPEKAKVEEKAATARTAVAATAGSSEGASGDAAPAAPAAPTASAAPTALAAPAAPRRTPRFGWCRDWLRTQLVGLTVRDDDGNSVRLCAVAGLRGEAYVERRAGGKPPARVYDLGFELLYEALLGGAAFEGGLVFAEVASHNELAEYDVTVRVGEAGPKEGTEAQTLLVQLLGPLRAEAALGAEGRLTQHVWARLYAFREEFAALAVTED